MSLFFIGYINLVLFNLATITGIAFLVYNLVNKRSKIVAIPNAKAKPLMGPTARI